MSESNNAGTVQSQACAQKSGDETLITVSRSSARLVVEVVIAIIVGFLIAFAAPVIVAWLATLPHEAWYAIGVAVAVVATAALCIRHNE